MRAEFFLLTDVVRRALIQFFQDIILYGFSTFLPSILKLDLGFSSLEAQYLSVPVYFLGGITFFVSHLHLLQALPRY